jgi:hypothetical protein
MLSGQVYALRAKPIAAKPFNCSDFLCAPGSAQNCLSQNMDYWSLGSLGSLVAGGTNVVAIEGCLGADDPLASVERCGPTWNAATGNLHLEVVPISNGGSADGGLLVQAAQLSPGLQSLAGDGGATVVSFGVDQGDAQAPVALLAQEGELLPYFPTALALPADLSAFGQMGFAVDLSGSASPSPAGHLWMSLAQAQQLVSPAQDPVAYYGTGGTYVVAVLGDPNAPHAFATDADAGYDGKGLHLLLLPAAPAGSP